MPATSYEQFQQLFEEAASREYETLSAMPLESLLERVGKQTFGEYYQLWPAIASKATLAEAGWPLFEVLNSKADYLVRYHCGDALIKIAGSLLAGWEPVMLSGEQVHPVSQNLAKVARIIEAAVGKRA